MPGPDSHTGSDFLVWGSGLRVDGARVRVLGLGICLGSRDQGLGFGVRTGSNVGFGSRFQRIRFQVSGFLLRVEGFRFQVSG